MGGVIVAHDASLQLSEMEGRQIWGVYAEKIREEADEGERKEVLKFTRGYDKFIQGYNVLAVEEVLNSDISAKKLIDAIRETGGNVIGLAVLVNRGGVKPKDIGEVPIISLLDVDMQSWESSNCQLCRDGISLNTKVGHAKNQ